MKIGKHTILTGERQVSISVGRQTISFPGGNSDRLYRRSVGHVRGFSE